MLTLWSPQWSPMNTKKVIMDTKPVKYWRLRCIDVQTGRHAKLAAGFGKGWKCHQGKEGWWLVSLAKETPDAYSDNHTFEVHGHLIGPYYSSPLWPILAFYEEAPAREWFEKLRQFLKTITPGEDHYDKEVNGDARLGAWLTANGFVRFNHIWWKQAHERV